MYLTFLFSFISTVSGFRSHLAILIQPSRNVSEEKVNCEGLRRFGCLVVSKNNTFSDGKETVKFPLSQLPAHFEKAAYTVII